MNTQQSATPTKMASALMAVTGITPFAVDNSGHKLSRVKRREGMPRKPVPEKQERFSEKKELIKLRDGQDFALAFECAHKDIPKGVKILALGEGGGNTINQENITNNDIRLSVAMVDLDGLMERVSVNSIKVTNRAGYLVAYVNCTVGKSKDVGFNHRWKGKYEAFVRRALMQTWNRAIAKESDGKMSLNLRKAVNKAAETKIRFAIE